MTNAPSTTITSTAPASEGSDNTSREGKTIPQPMTEGGNTPPAPDTPPPDMVKTRAMQAKPMEKTGENPLGQIKDKIKNKVGKGDTATINPNEIRYSQSSVNGSSEIIDSMKQNGWKGDPIDVVEMPDGVYTTIDNTRVVSAREAGIDVQATIHNYNDPLPIEYVERFTTKQGVPTTWGEAIELRIGKQKASFRNTNPFGSFEMENIK